MDEVSGASPTCELKPYVVSGCEEAGYICRIIHLKWVTEPRNSSGRCWLIWSRPVFPNHWNDPVCRGRLSGSTWLGETPTLKALAWVMVRRKQTRYTGDKLSPFCYTWCAGEDYQNAFCNTFGLAVWLKSPNQVEPDNLPIIWFYRSFLAAQWLGNTDVKGEGPTTNFQPVGESFL